jgi:hypothetical protein
VRTCAAASFVTRRLPASSRLRTRLVMVAESGPEETDLHVVRGYRRHEPEIMTGPASSSSHETRSWSKPDSNSRSHPPHSPADRRLGPASPSDPENLSLP